VTGATDQPAECGERGSKREKSGTLSVESKTEAPPSNTNPKTAPVEVSNPSEILVNVSNPSMIATRKMKKT